MIISFLSRRTIEKKFKILFLEKSILIKSNEQSTQSSRFDHLKTKEMIKKLLHDQFIIENV
jgi:hypothetical protein